MKRVYFVLGAIMIILCFACEGEKGQKTYFKETGSGNVHEPNAAGLSSELNYIKSKLGIKSYLFEFVIPKEKKLVATFRAEMNGNLVPELSNIFYFPILSAEDVYGGTINIYFYNSPFLMDSHDNRILEIFCTLWGSKRNTNYHWQSRFPPELQGEDGGSSGGSAYLSDFSDEQEYEVWQSQTKYLINNRFENVMDYSLKVKLLPEQKGDTQERFICEQLK